MPRAGRALRHHDDGMSLVEVMVAMGLFVLGSLSLLAVITSSAAGSYDNRARLTAASLAATDIDEARALPYAALKDKITPKTVDGRAYSVIREVEPTPASSTEATTCLGAGSTRQLHKRVSTRVETAFRGRTKPVRSDTIVRSPIFDPANADGAIGLVVLDRTGDPLPGMPMQVAGTTRATDARGCVYFDGLPAGAYSVNVVTAGWVTLAGTTSVTMTVRTGQITSQVVRIGQTARTVVGTELHDGVAAITSFTTWPHWAWPTDKLTVRLATPERALPTRSETSPQALPSHTAEVYWDGYPHPAGYEAYLNPCSTPVRVRSEPGTNTPRAVVPLRPVKVHLRVFGSQDNKARQRTVAVQRAPGVDCGEPPVYAPSAMTTNSTCVGDCIVHVALPGGTWRFTALANGGSQPERSTVATVSGGAATVEIDVS